MNLSMQLQSQPLQAVQHGQMQQKPSPPPAEIAPRQVLLKDRITAATLVPFTAPQQVPHPLLSNVCYLLNREIEEGNTYPMIDQMDVESFATYWFGKFGAIMLLGDAQTVDDLLLSNLTKDEWAKHCLGSFYIKPNYPGRSSHVCNAGFLVSDVARNKGVGRLMGEGYLDWAPKLGYSYSVFNLVYETNVASCKIWDSLGFKRIGRVKGCGNLRGYPDRLVDAIQYGKDLQPDGEDFASDDRFNKIRYYLKHGKYPDGADRAEKSRLRSAATHYRLVQADGSNEEKLMLKDKEVISDPVRQDDIARAAHSDHHAGINKTTAIVAEKYHWPGIKASVSLAIKNCNECSAREAAKMPPARDIPATTEMISAVQSLGAAGAGEAGYPEAQNYYDSATSAQQASGSTDDFFMQTSGSFGIDCGTVTVDPARDAVLLLRNPGTGETMLPQGIKGNGLDLLESALAVTSELSGVYCEPLQDNLLPFTTGHAPKQDPFAVTHRSAEGRWKMTYWFLAKAQSHLPRQQQSSRYEMLWIAGKEAGASLSHDRDKRVLAEAMKITPVTPATTSMPPLVDAHVDAPIQDFQGDFMALDPQLTLRTPGTGPGA